MPTSTFIKNLLRMRGEPSKSLDSATTIKKRRQLTEDLEAVNCRIAKITIGAD